MAKKIMVQGTSSNVGKSILTTGLCRFFYEEGYRVAPFKAQNMALNSYILKDGREVGRSTAIQAEAAEIEPTVDMNPILLKPIGNSASQLIVHGKSLGDFTAADYHNKQGIHFFDKVTESLERLDRNFDVIVIEGAGSPAEVNLKDNDIVNMRVALHAQCPVLLVADIERGGAIASIVGTLELLEPEERKLIVGIIINKFRGDLSLLQPALDFIEAKTGKPVLGVLPYIENHGIEEEDSLGLDTREVDALFDLDIAIIRFPRIANFADFQALSLEEGVRVRYVETPTGLGSPDLIILPDTSDVLGDLDFIRKNGLESQLIAHSFRDIPVMGIGGGYQMLGEELTSSLEDDPDPEVTSGLGLLPLNVKLVRKKRPRNVTVNYTNDCFLGKLTSCKEMNAYQMEAGTITVKAGAKSDVFKVHFQKESFWDGVINESGGIIGTSLQGLWENDGYRRDVLNNLRNKKNNLELQTTKDYSYSKKKKANYQNLSQTIRENVNIDQLKQILFG